MTFRTIKDWPAYEVSDTGVVRWRWNLKVVRPFKINKGYLIVALKGKTKLVHRLVLETWGTEPPTGRHCNHKDGRKTNNHISNLEWVTPRQNMRHSREVLGNKHGYDQKLSPDAIVALRRSNSEHYSGSQPRSWWPRSELAHNYGVSKSAIGRAIGGHH